MHTGMKKHLLSFILKMRQSHFRVKYLNREPGYFKVLLNIVKVTDKL